MRGLRRFWRSERLFGLSERAGATGATTPGARAGSGLGGGWHFERRGDLVVRVLNHVWYVRWKTAIRFYGAGV